MTIAEFWRKYKVDVGIVALLLVVAGLPRLLDLGLFLTADEKNWIGRSYEFVRAFKDFRFNDMLQTTHPGVTVLWLSGITVAGTTMLAHIPFSFANLFYFVWSTQFVVALLNTFLIGLLYVLLRILLLPLLGDKTRWVATIAVLFVALNPFYVGYSRVTHIDAVLTGFLLTACISVVIYAQQGFSRKWLVLSGIISAMALLSKVPAVFVVPFFLLTSLVYMKWFWGEVVSRLRDFALWLLLIGALVLVIWPALVWVPNPEGNILVLKRDISIAAETPHNMSEDYTLNALHYPAALLTRTTPVSLGLVLIGALAVLYALYSRKVSPEQARVYGLLVAYVFFFVFMMTLGAKKGDRYILPVYPMIDVLAVLTLYWLTRSWKMFLSIAGLCLVYLLSVVAWYHPYALAYSNPLFPDNLSQELGWGEGLDQVAVWLNENDPQAVVASWYPEELGAFTSAQVAHINAHEQNKVKYVVLYHNMFGRAPDHYANDFIDEYYKKREPVFVAYVAGKEFAWVYEKPAYDGIAGELVPGRHLGQEVEIINDNMSALEFFPATYSGNAKGGNLRVTLRDVATGNVLESWRVPVSDLVDSEWTRLPVTAKVYKGQKLFFDVVGEGTSTVEKTAPTLRTATDSGVRPGVYGVDVCSGYVDKPGDLALRMLYMIDGQFVTEEQKKLLIGN